MNLFSSTKSLLLTSYHITDTSSLSFFLRSNSCY